MFPHAPQLALSRARSVQRSPQRDIAAAQGLGTGAASSITPRSRHRSRALAARITASPDITARAAEESPPLDARISTRAARFTSIAKHPVAGEVTALELP